MKKYAESRAASQFDAGFEENLVMRSSVQSDNHDTSLCANG